MQHFFVPVIVLILIVIILMLVAWRPALVAPFSQHAERPYCVPGAWCYIHVKL